MSLAPSPPGGVHVLVAVKDLAEAKSRLAEDFDTDTRAQLVLSMLIDTIAAATAAPTVTAWSAVTPDPHVVEAVRDLGGSVIGEPCPGHLHPDGGLNAALATAARLLRVDGQAPDVLALQADLPALRTEEVTEALACAQPGRSVVLDHTGRGTAALILRGHHGDLHPLFGPDSARRHLDSGARPLSGRWPGLRLDVDTIDDLRSALELGVGASTRALVDHIGWPGSE